MDIVKTIAIYFTLHLIALPAMALDPQSHLEIEITEDLDREFEQLIEKELFKRLTLPKLKRDARGGDSWAQTELGHRYFSGLGAKRNFKRAFYWHKLAAQQGVEFSQYSLGLIYRGADSTLKDWQKAHMWVSIAYHNGHIRSKNILQQLQLHLTTEQVLEAGKNANLCIFSDYQDCGWPEQSALWDNIEGSDQAASTSPANMVFPVIGKIVRKFDKGNNEGIDIAGMAGAPVVAAASGWVAAISEDDDGAPIMIIMHDDGLMTVYANIYDIEVSKDDFVEKGQKIAVLGMAENASMHFEVRNGYDSVDPMPHLE